MKTEITALAAGDGRMSENDDKVKLKSLLDLVRKAIAENDKTITYPLVS